MYEYPIVLLTLQDAQINPEGLPTLSAVLGLNVDVEELRKALEYDRNQYRVGYQDGYADGRERGMRDALYEISQLVEKQIQKERDSKNEENSDSKATL